MSQNSKDGQDSKDIDFRGAILEIWIGRWWLLSFILSFSLLAVVYSLWTPGIYRSEALLAPNTENVDSLASIAGRYSGIAGIAGISFGDSNADKSEIALEVLQSRKFLISFINRHGLIVSLLAAKGWNARTGELEIDDAIYDREKEEWRISSSIRPSGVPSSMEAYRKFNQALTVNRDKNSGLVRVSLDHYSPYIAKRWLELLIADLNFSIMNSDVEKAENAIRYLREQVESTSLSGLQNVFFSLIEEQTKTILLARVSPEYAFQTIDPPMAPEKRLRPKRMMLAAIGFVVGLFLGLGFLFAKYQFSNTSNQQGFQ